MVRGLVAGSFALYVYDERGAPHHLPHAHIKQGRRRVASIYLLTLEVYDNRDALPKAVLDAIRLDQQRLIELWEELNKDE